MSNLDLLVKKYTIKQDRLIKKICAPLNDCLDIPIFSYFRIESDGRFGNLSNFPEEFDYFYSEKLYLNYPYLVHPNLVQTGSVWTNVAHSQDASERIFDRYGMQQLLLKLQRHNNVVEGFVFAPKGFDPDDSKNYYGKLDLINSFISYFRREAKPLLKNMMGDQFNLKEVKGDAFFKIDSSLPLANSNPKVLKFLKTVSPLSHREQQCLDLFKQGHSAQATGAILKLSRRTVEHYFDNIKDKLGCTTKSELLEL